jgi:tetratricopeptide (TPR) repeat protein
MNFDDFDEIDDFDEEVNNLHELIATYQQQIEAGEFAFFDLDDMELIIDHFIINDQQDKADFAIQNAEAIYPKHPAVFLKKAFFASYSEKFYEAKKWIEKATYHLKDSNYDESIFLQKRAEIYVDLEEYYQALTDLEEALQKRDDDFAFIQDQLEDLYMILFNFNLKKKHRSPFPLLHNLVPILEEDHYLFLIKHYTYESVKIFRHFIREFPLNHQLWYFLGIAQKENYAYDEAIESFEYALAIDPDSPTAKFHQAVCYKETGLYEQAIHVLIDIEFAHEDSGLIYYELGENLKELELYDEAIKYYKLAIDKEHKLGKAYFALAKIVIRYYRDYPLALQYINQALQEDSSDPLYQFLKADILVLTGDYDEAEDYYLQSLKANPDNSLVWLNYSELFASQNQYDKAIEILDRQLDKNYFDTLLLTRRFNYLWKSGRKEEAFANLSLILITEKEAIAHIFEYDESLFTNIELMQFIETAKETNKPDRNKKS